VSDEETLVRCKQYASQRAQGPCLLVASRLRTYFTLRRQLGTPYLGLLQFFLNHRTYLRSQRPEWVGKSPAQLLTGTSHPHWLELLGFTRFQRT
jgi:hypothetical protein